MPAGFGFGAGYGLTVRAGGYLICFAHKPYGDDRTITEPRETS